MSATVAAVKLNIRKLLGDLRAGSEAVAHDSTMTALIDSWVTDIGATLGYADTWVSNAITLVSGTSDYALTSSDYQVLDKLKRSDDHYLLDKISWAEMENLRSTSVYNTGKPTRYALYEDSSQQLQVRLDPVPDYAGNLDAFLSSSVSQMTGDTGTVPFSRLALRTLELSVAGELIAGLDEARLALLGINPALGAAYSARAQVNLIKEKERRTVWGRTDHIVRTRY